MNTKQERHHSALDVLRRIRARPVWLLHDLPPALEECQDPVEYCRGMALWYRLRQQSYTMLGCRRGRYLHRLAHLVDKHQIPGDLVDCGVWNGGSTVLMARGAPGRPVWAFDSFEGLPEPGAVDGGRSAGWKGLCEGSVEKVQEAFRRYSSLDQLHVVKGWFEDSFPVTVTKIDKVAVLHADGDWYDSVLFSLRAWYPKLSNGGYVIVDDYGHWEGARKATDEFRSAEGINTPLKPIDGNAVYWQKD